jgi:hypothetical protein
VKDHTTSRAASASLKDRLAVPRSRPERKTTANKRTLPRKLPTVREVSPVALTSSPASTELIPTIESGEGENAGRRGRGVQAEVGRARRWDPEGRMGGALVVSGSLVLTSQSNQASRGKGRKERGTSSVCRSPLRLERLGDSEGSAERSQEFYKHLRSPHAFLHPLSTSPSSSPPVPPPLRLGGG